MSIGDKAKHKAEEAVGKVKETTGKATDNERLEAEGQADQSAANIKQAGDDVRDAFKK
ncbi:CsbD-like protein [Isoptericola jiangsuensis]|uniref:CsbD-like protein n=1 Tax=Isoptericola jiangsuensis TaxID=548579 RepID=A0A2A9EZ55_9MICO|nr:CsbD family protein [Isoptericola jiangsuensis]PFG43592.1 CsbD-like protein [Isoptericola jiangsuensis]